AAAWNERSSDPSGWTGHVAFWDGRRWSPPITGPFIGSLVMFDGRPTAQIWGSSGSEVQAWNGQTWVPLGSPGEVASPYGAVLFTDGDSLYFGGQFRNETTASSTPVLKVWSGGGWSVRASATGGPNSGYVLTLGASAGQLILGGLLTEVDGASV